ncbi:MAG: GNAT family N-acetyltransferase [Actinomycetota bacterium]
MSRDAASPAIAFRPLAEDDFDQLVTWFGEPEIATWWNQAAEYDAVRAKYQPRIEGREPTEMWIVEINGEPAGLFQCYRHDDYNETDAAVGVPDAVGIDYLIGGAHRGRGLGRLALAAFGRHALQRFPDAQVCVATPAIANGASRAAVERAGFTYRGTCQPPDEPPAAIYGLDRTD